MKYKFETYTNLNPILFQEWKSAWEKSQNRHLFNSPYWFDACIKTYKYDKTIIVVARSNKKIAGLIPLVKDKKFGFNLFLSPGGKYLDKTTFLKVENSSSIFPLILRQISKEGDYYLTEIAESEILNIKKHNPKIKSHISSTSRILEFNNDPFRYLNRENLRRIKKRISDNVEEISFSVIQNDIQTIEKTLRKVEANSSKPIENKGIFSDKRLIDLYEKIQKYNNNIVNFSFLYFRNKPIAFMHGYEINNKYHFSNTAFDKKYSKYSPGKVLMYLTIKNIFEGGIESIDFSRGDTQFKQEFTPFKYKQYTIFNFKNPIANLMWNIFYFIRPIIEKNDWIMTKLIK